MPFDFKQLLLASLAVLGAITLEGLAQAADYSSSASYNSPYGLSGSLWTRDLGRAIRVTKAVRTGVISVNSPRSVRTEAPFGGFKRSGLGRELGMAAMDHYTEVKNVFYSDE